MSAPESLSAHSLSERDVDRALEETAVLLEPGWGVLRVQGEDRATWLNGVVTCDVTTVDRTRGAWGFLLSKQGKIEAELHVASSGDELFVATPPGAADGVRATLDRYLVMEDAELSSDPGYTWLALHGARAGELAQVLRERHGGASARLDWTSAGGAALAVPLATRGECVAELERQGVLPLSLGEFEASRVRLGLPRFGVDYTSSDNPHEAGLERRAVSWTKGCYLGQEVVCMQDMRGKVKRRLVRLAFDSQGVEVSAGSEVVDEAGAAQGAIKSSALGVAIASVKAPAYEPGSALVVEGHVARVHPLFE